MFEQSMTSAARTELARMEALIPQRDDARSIPRASAEFLHMLVLAGGFRSGLEIGTSYGHSALWIGSALRHNGGQLVTIDKDPAKVAHARDAFARAELSETIRIVEHDAESALNELDGPFDFAFVDADKEPSVRYFTLIVPKLAPRATIVTDNVISHEEKLRDFVTHVRAQHGFASTVIAVGSGLEVTVRL